MAVANALNDLPSIYPLQVTVMATSLSSGTQYQITFPAEMGDGALVNVITTGTSNVTEIVQGVASGSKCAFQIDGTLTSYIDLQQMKLVAFNKQSIKYLEFNVQYHCWVATRYRVILSIPMISKCVHTMKHQFCSMHSVVNVHKREIR
ncbi:unnamed protein product [Didymodactylos carnosus]|uniref:Uncharacterized protein n=1 Tax=Didymodactylos carnosus TaxID=1234261 RepID=A0A8S2YMY8_9BILA|nr:unnamed protein product [Didymodactylos carnosus]